MSKVHVIDGVQYREVSREAEVGDYVMFEEAPRDYLTADKPYEIIEIDSAGDPQITDDDGDEFDTCDKEYVVLEKISEGGVDMANVIVHEGVQYRKVERAVREGDKYIVAKKDELDITAGKVYVVVGMDSYGDPKFHDDVDDMRTCLWEGNYYVLEPFAPAQSALESELAEVKAKVAELERKIAEQAEMVAEAKRKLARPKYNSGDKVRGRSGSTYVLTERAPEKDNRGRGIAWLYETSAHSSTAWIGEEQIAGLVNTAEQRKEAEEKERKQAEEAKWARIGRKVGEFKAGDIVRVNDDYSDISARNAGDIDIIKHIGGIRNRPHVGRGSYTLRAYINPEHLELIAPVESVVNLRVS